MSTAEIAQIYRFQLLSQSLAAAEVQPLAGMLVQSPGQRGRKGPSPKTYVAVGASTGALQLREVEWVLTCPTLTSCEQTLVSFRESEAMEGVHLTLISDDAKLRETFAVELTADTFVPRGKIAKQRKVLRDRDQARHSSFRVQIKSRSSMSTGRFSRKEMEALCGGGNTSITRVKRAILELARRINLKLLEWEPDSSLPGDQGRDSTLDGRPTCPFTWKGSWKSSWKLWVLSSTLSMRRRGARAARSKPKSPKGTEQQGARWLELSDIDRITMEAASQECWQPA
ncbi:hypothetical protein GUITHDRAFT_122154 [Guillardia theta CCMP2712]|uniref:Uncharacterized protein n=1 Tax=Guillardia theta (strain CCMP2712) TaxID=905079 RepID=L1I6E4_GUITC|nr:hypothetical protein GUITHDRAFT_122154 [Guillardia theta CCMP2712]EKX31667.1 hypothetical protein GUITHDRAFT_122154 [Guillardia theta CCMP2712]|eukprot:XP_005818647.1 hypothetical protein GUITHDRAFT_122154 [Guillardia theta CCMP2712]